jgi:4-diphosphocytidyl-2-C-methyl-D-erythritol kinase
MTKQDKSKKGWAIRWSAPAKLNLMLSITGRREDGYHLLQTVFQLIDITDGLIFTESEDNSVHLKKPIPGVKEEDDLTVRAANILKQETGYKGGVCIEMEKNLPMGGGLGGGSSDAATVLVVLNSLWKLGLTKKRLMMLGVQLGADVPVFVNGTSVWAEGVGEKLTLIDLPKAWYVVVKPSCHVDTGKVFLEKGLTRDSKSIKMADFNVGKVRNDCLAVVRKLHSEVDEALNELSAYGEARLTGTGACVFVQFDNEEDAKKVFDLLPLKREKYLTQGLANSPLQNEMREIFNI